jgi:transcriptional regulator with XRE-family HTH domain
MLRFYRARSGLSQEQLGALIHFSADQVSKVETGLRTPTREFIATCDACPELGTAGALGELRERLDGYFKQRAYPGWFAHWTDYEARATALRWYESLVVPGLLQTPDYAHAVLRTRVGASDEQIDEMVTARIERQTVLERDYPPTLWVVLDEGVLRRPVGGPTVIAGQLRHMLGMAQRPNIVIQVIPATAGAHEGLRGPFMIADFADAPSVAWQDAAVFGQLIEAADGIASLMVMWDTLKSEALPRSASQALMEEAAKTWT